MLYGKIKKEYDNSNIFINGIYKCTVIKDELYTITEIKKYSIPEKWLDFIELPKNESYFCFGCRFNKGVEKC